MSGTLTITIPPLFHVPAGRVLTQIYFKNLLLFNTSRMVVSQCFGTHFPAVRQACGRHLVWDVTFEWLPSCVMCYIWVAAILCEVLHLSGRHLVWVVTFEWPSSCVRCYIWMVAILCDVLHLSGRHLVWDVTFEWLPSCVRYDIWMAAILCDVLHLSGCHLLWGVKVAAILCEMLHSILDPK